MLYMLSLCSHLLNLSCYLEVCLQISSGGTEKLLNSLLKHQHSTFAKYCRFITKLKISKLEMFCSFFHHHLQAPFISFLILCALLLL